MNVDHSAEGGQSVDRWIISERVLGADLSEHAWALGIRAGRIVALEPAAEIRAGSQLDKSLVTDFRQRPIVPGWVNAHTHLAMAPLRGMTDTVARRGNVVRDVFFQVEKHLETRDVYVFSKLAAYESLLHGVTEVWDHYYHGAAVGRALTDVGLAGVVAPTLQDRSGPGVELWEASLDETSSLADGSDQGSVRAAVGLHASDTASRELFQQAGELARRLGIPAHLHLAQSADEMRASRRFERPLVDEVLESLRGVPTLMAHGLWLTRADLERLVEARWVLAHCSLSQVQFGFLGPLGPWAEAGGTWVLGTDCVASNDALDLQREIPWAASWDNLAVGFSDERWRLLEGRESLEELENARAQRAGRSSLLDLRQLLAAAWGPASVLERRQAAGPGIALGNWAHLQVLEADHPTLFPGRDLARTLAYGQTSGAIHQLIVAGRDLGEAGHFASSLLSSPGYRELRTEAVARARELLRRAGV